MLTKQFFCEWLQLAEYITDITKAFVSSQEPSS